jgi:NrS-1  polymerase HBD domain/Family of unknown function (DUF5906)
MIPNNFLIYDAQKNPLNPHTGYRVSINDTSAYVSYQQAVIAVKKHQATGVAFVIHEPFFFIDIDDCITNGIMSPLAHELIAQFKSAYIETSISGNGIHIIGQGIAPPHKCRREDIGLEFYTERRFVALTLTEATGSMEFDASKLLPAFVQRYMALPAPEALRDETRDVRAPDDELIDKALASHSALNKTVQFADLWFNHTDALAKAYPASDEREYDYNRADAALAQHLAFWTNNDHERIERLMRRSDLVREKWERSDYLLRTIRQACAKQQSFYHEPRKSPKTFDRFLSIEQQIEFFEGCIYIVDDHKILIPGGSLLNAERFRVAYGGHVFMLDTANEKTTRNAWEAFTESQGHQFPRAQSTVFRPAAAPGAIIMENGAAFANTYWPVPVEAIPGDVTPFLNHINRLLPTETDRECFLSYLAAIVQSPGVKFQYCVVLQGVEGNGKTLFSQIMRRALGARYCHSPKASEVTSRFNDWMYRRIFISIEDVPPRRTEEALEKMKEIITGNYQEIEPKGGVRLTREVCCNFLINTNHKEAARKTENDRRYAVFFTGQQCIEDLKKDGMTPEYFDQLFGWLSHRKGYEMVTHYLRTYRIPSQYNPALGRRAPNTTSTKAALAANYDDIIEIIQEAIDNHQPGFRDGWISSGMLDHLFKYQRNLHIPYRKRYMALQHMGYVKHPHLKDGQATRITIPDGVRPRLFIRTDRLNDDYDPLVDVCSAYEDAQRVS